MWYLHELAAWLRQRGRSRFLLTAPPLRLSDVVGYSLTPSPPSDAATFVAERAGPCTTGGREIYRCDMGTPSAKASIVSALTVASMLVGCGAEADPVGGQPLPAPTATDRTVGAESDSSLPSTTSTQPSTTSTTGATTGDALVSDTVSIEVDEYRIVATLPRDAKPDPLGDVAPERSVIQNRRWMTECCWLSVTSQTERPRFPDSQLQDTVDVNGLEWEIYDAGGEDGTEIDAVTSIGAISITVATQQRFPDRQFERTPTELVRSMVDALIVEER
jgi:hypothetical protein